MAKWEGTQEIPSELETLWYRSLTIGNPKNITRKRFPWRMPLFQEGGYKVTPGQEEQRARVKAIIEKFNAVPYAERQRWYAASPPWGSVLWYFNYFMMSGLMGNADINHGGAGVIKNIQFKTISMPEGTGEGSVAITAVDPAKTVVMIYGNSVLLYELDTPSIVYPYVSEISAELVKCKWSLTNYGSNLTYPAIIGITVIEYI